MGVEDKGRAERCGAARRCAALRCAALEGRNRNAPRQAKNTDRRSPTAAQWAVPAYTSLHLRRRPSPLAIAFSHRPLLARRRLTQTVRPSHRSRISSASEKQAKPRTGPHGNSRRDAEGGGVGGNEGRGAGEGGGEEGDLVLHRGDWVRGAKCGDVSPVLPLAEAERRVL